MVKFKLLQVYFIEHGSMYCLSSNVLLCYTIPLNNMDFVLPLILIDA
jgi:hypothetical protein